MHKYRGLTDLEAADAEEVADDDRNRLCENADRDRDCRVDERLGRCFHLLRVATGRQVLEGGDKDEDDGQDDEGREDVIKDDTDRGEDAVRILDSRVLPARDRYGGWLNLGERDRHRCEHHGQNEYCKK